MILTDYLLSEESVQWHYAKQMGIDHAVIRLPDDPSFDLGSRKHWDSLYRRYTGFGFTPVVVEPLPNRLHDHIKEGSDKRDASIETLIRMLSIMNELDIRVLCFNFMAHVGWCRTRNDIRERGGACVTGFDRSEYRCDDEYTITHDALWENYRYFLSAVLPYAEKYNIRLALHPDDPPVLCLGGVSRILTSFDNIKKAINMIPSAMIGVTMCQGSYAAMGEPLDEVISYFRGQNKLFYIHFRDIVGDRNCFHETFHDNGKTDMAKVLKCYLDNGVDVPIRVDHVPLMAGENNDTPGYTSLGRLYAVGYLRGLLEGIGYSHE